MKAKFKIGQVVKFKNLEGNWQYERVFAIGKCERHLGLNHVRITIRGYTPSASDIEDGGVDCGCLGDIKTGPLALNAKEKGA